MLSETIAEAPRADRGGHPVFRPPILSVLAARKLRFFRLAADGAGPGAKSTPPMRYPEGDRHATRPDHDPPPDPPPYPQPDPATQCDPAWARCHYLDGAGYEVFTGIGPDLMTGARQAVEGAIDWLGKSRNMPAEQAYMLCSVCGDLRISEIVDAPNWVVSFYPPRILFK